MAERAGRLVVVLAVVVDATVRLIGVVDVADVVLRVADVVDVGLAGVAALGVADVVLGADVTLLVGAVAGVRLAMVVVVVVVVVFLIAAAETGGLAVEAAVLAAKVVLGAAAGLAEVVEGAAGVAFLNGDNLVGRAGLAASDAGALASVAAVRLFSTE